MLNSCRKLMMACSLTLCFEDENIARMPAMLAMLSLLCQVSSSLHIGFSVLDSSQFA